MSRIVVIGSANIDFVANVVQLPRPGETVMGTSYATFFGGKGANQAVAAARLGAQVSFIGCVGSDDFGAQYVQHLSREGIDVTQTKRGRDTSTGCALIFVAEGGENVIVVCPNANSRLQPDDIDAAADAIRAASLVVLQLEIPIETVQRSVELARQHSVPVLLNPSPLPQDFRVPCGIRYLVLNSGEAAALTGTSPDDTDAFVSAAAVLWDAGVENIIITRGSRSTVLCTPRSMDFVETVGVTPVDTVGAGDTFTGAFAVAITEGHTPAEAAGFANRAAAIATTRLGAQTSMPRREEIR